MKALLTVFLFGICINLCIQLRTTKGKKNHKSILGLLITSIVFCSAVNWGLIYIETNGYEIIFNSLTLLLFIYTLFLYIKHDYKFHIKNDFIFLMICLAIIVLIILVQVLELNIYNAENYLYILFTYINLGLILMVFYNLNNFEYNIELITYPIAIFSLANSILGVLQFKTGKVLININDSDAMIRAYSTIKRASGFAGGDNGAGNLGAILLPVLLYNYNKKKDLFNLSLIILDILFTVITFTRIGYLAVTVELIIYIFVKSKFNTFKNVFVNIGKITCISAILIYFYFNIYNNFYQVLFIDRGDTASTRFIQFKNAFAVFLTTPLLGAGTGQYNGYLLNTKGIYDLYVIHSQLINTLVEGGIILFIIFIIFNLYIIIRLIKIYKGKVELLYISILILGNLISTNFNPNQYYALNIYIYYIILFGFLFSKNKKDLDKKYDFINLARDRRGKCKQK